MGVGLITGYPGQMPRPSGWGSEPARAETSRDGDTAIIAGHRRQFVHPMLGRDGEPFPRVDQLEGQEKVDKCEMGSSGEEEPIGG
jgi:hypothetical protein